MCLLLNMTRATEESREFQRVPDVEDKLFTNVLNNDQHVLFHILPDHNNHMYSRGLDDMNLH